MSGDNCSIGKKHTNIFKIHEKMSGLFLHACKFSLRESEKSEKKKEANLRAERICVHHLFQACRSTCFIRALPRLINYGLHYNICIPLLLFTNILTSIYSFTRLLKLLSSSVVKELILYTS